MLVSFVGDAFCNSHQVLLCAHIFILYCFNAVSTNTSHIVVDMLQLCECVNSYEQLLFTGVNRMSVLLYLVWSELL